MNKLILSDLRSLLFIVVASLIFASCGSDELPGPGEVPKPVDNSKGIFELYLNYWNPTGKDPKIEFDAVKTSPEIKIDFNKPFNAHVIGTHLVDVIIDNVRISDAENANYKIKKISAFEFVNQEWFEDTEFRMSYSLLQDLLVYLVLDVSQSLGDDFDNVKLYASDFVAKIFDDAPGARVGVVDFATNVNLFNATNDKNGILAYINGVSPGQFTSLYEAMDLGVEKLLNTNAESKSILTFTDGGDNNSDTTFNPTSLRAKMLNSTGNIKVISFTVGLGGRVNRSVLEDLALNGGSSAFPKNAMQLKSVFQDFSKTISQVYALTYQRNQQIIPANDKRILKFVIEADIN